MWRALAIMGLWVEAAYAQPASCVDSIAVWTTPYQQGSIQAVSFFQWQQAPPTPSPLPLLAVLYRTGEFHLHVNVPLSVAQPFTSLASADQRYNGSIKNKYHQALLGEGLCPLLNETGTYLLAETP